MIEQGTSKLVLVKRQTALGVPASELLGQIVRRTSAQNELNRESYTSESEMTSTQQVKSLRLGTKGVKSSLDGLWSPGTYSEILSAVMRRDFTAAAPITALGLTISGAGPVYTLTRAAGSFLTSPAKLGMVFRLSLAMNPLNLGKNLLILSMTATALTVAVLDGSALVAEGPIAGVTMTFPGKVTYIPDSGHTNIYWTVEDRYPSIPFSERNFDVKYHKADVSLPGNGNATIKFSGDGLNQTDDAAAYFTTMVAETSTEILAAAGGFLMIGGVPQGVVTDQSISIDGKGQPADGVVGTTLRPDVFTGKVVVTGSLTVYFDSPALAQKFKTETPVSIIGALVNGGGPMADAVGYAMTNVKLTSNSPDDVPTGLKRTYSYQSIWDASGGDDKAFPATSLTIHDSAAA